MHLKYIYGLSFNLEKKKKNDTEKKKKSQVMPSRQNDLPCKLSGMFPGL